MPERRLRRFPPWKEGASEGRNIHILFHIHAGKFRKNEKVDTIIRGTQEEDWMNEPYDRTERAQACRSRQM
jgi:hypothetical protein